MDEYYIAWVGWTLKALRRTPKCVNSEVLGHIEELTRRLKEGEIRFDDKDSYRPFEKLALALVRRQQERTKTVKHGGFWQEWIFDEGGGEEFFDIVRIPTAKVTSFLATYYLLSPKKNEKVKEAVIRALRFNGIFYIGCDCEDGFFLPRRYYGSSKERLNRLFKTLIGGLVPQFAALFYREDERLLPILSFLVKTYRAYREEYELDEFLMTGELPPQVKHLSEDEKAVNFIKRLRGRAGILDEDTLYEIERVTEDMEKQFRKAHFNPENFREPDFVNYSSLK